MIVVWLKSGSGEPPKGCGGAPLWCPKDTATQRGFFNANSKDVNGSSCSYASTSLSLNTP